ncbi:MAG: NUDIX domain-containing protein [Fidelibacterota bacterium]
MTHLGIDHVDSYVYRWDGDRPRYLLLKRRKQTHYGHLWQGVAGKMAGTETASETVIREVREETGLEPVHLVVVDYVSSFYQNHRDRIHLVPVFGVQVDSPHVRLSDEHTEFRWVHLPEAQSLLAWRQQKEAIQVLHEMLTEDDGRMTWSEIDVQD